MGSRGGAAGGGGGGAVLEEFSAELTDRLREAFDNTPILEFVGDVEFSVSERGAPRMAFTIEKPVDDRVARVDTSRGDSSIIDGAVDRALRGHPLGEENPFGGGTFIESTEVLPNTTRYNVRWTGPARNLTPSRTRPRPIDEFGDDLRLDDLERFGSGRLTIGDERGLRYIEQIDPSLFR